MQAAATRAATMLTQNVDAIAIENDSWMAWTMLRDQRLDDACAPAAVAARIRCPRSPVP